MRPGVADLVDRFTGEAREVKASLVVDAGHRLPADALWRARPQLTRAGDAVAPRTIYEAVLEGRRAAESLKRGGRMSGSRYKHVFTPLRLGPVTIANRIVFSAHLTNYAEDGLPTRQHADYYAARARGGAGLIITEEHSTHPTDWPYEKLIHGFHPAVIPGYRRITDAVHRHNTPIFAQINHNGGQASGMYTRLPVWAPSPVADPLFREVPKEVDEREIAEIIAGYALVAEHCRDGGFDGIELQCSHSSIVRGFLSPATNVRTDRWGGSLDNRARLLLELVAAVREAIGRDMALGVRLCGDELIEGGTTIDEAVEVAETRRGERSRRLPEHLDRRRDADALHDRSLAWRCAPGTRSSSPPRCAARPGCRWSASDGSRTRCRPTARSRRDSATWSASSAARSPTPTSPASRAPATARTSGSACRATRNASGAWA